MATSLRILSIWIIKLVETKNFGNFDPKFAGRNHLGNVKHKIVKWSLRSLWIKIIIFDSSTNQRISTSANSSLCGTLLCLKLENSVNLKIFCLFSWNFYYQTNKLENLISGPIGAPKWWFKTCLRQKRYTIVIVQNLCLALDSFKFSILNIEYLTSLFCQAKSWDQGLATI